MNCVITLPYSLIHMIMNQRKLFEMRKSVPKYLNIGRDGFFCCEKGTKNVLCWCRVDDIIAVENISDILENYRSRLCVDSSYIIDYMNGNKVYLWRIGKVICFEKPLHLQYELLVDKAPQSFVYTPLSYGESF